MLDARRTRPVLIALLVVAVALVTIDFRDGGTSARPWLRAAACSAPSSTSGATSPARFRGAAGNSAEVAKLQRDDPLQLELGQAEAAAQGAAGADRPPAPSPRTTTPMVAATVTGRRRLLGHGDDQRGQRRRHRRERDRAQRRRPRRHGRRPPARPPRRCSSRTDANATVGIRMAGDGQIGALGGTANDFPPGTAPLKLTLSSATHHQTGPGAGHLRLRRRPPVRARHPDRHVSPRSPPSRVHSPRPPWSSRSPTSPGSASSGSWSASERRSAAGGRAVRQRPSRGGRRSSSPPPDRALRRRRRPAHGGEPAPAARRRRPRPGAAAGRRGRGLHQPDDRPADRLRGRPRARHRAARDALRGGVRAGLLPGRVLRGPDRGRVSARTGERNPWVELGRDGGRGGGGRGGQGRARPAAVRPGRHRPRHQACAARRHPGTCCSPRSRTCWWRGRPGSPARSPSARRGRSSSAPSASRPCSGPRRPAPPRICGWPAPARSSRPTARRAGSRSCAWPTPIKIVRPNGPAGSGIAPPALAGGRTARLNFAGKSPALRSSGAGVTRLGRTPKLNFAGKSPAITPPRSQKGSRQGLDPHPRPGRDHAARQPARPGQGLDPGRPSGRLGRLGRPRGRGWLRHHRGRPPAAQGRLAADRRAPAPARRQPRPAGQGLAPHIEAPPRQLVLKRPVDRLGAALPVQGPVAVRGAGRCRAR